VDRSWSAAVHHIDQQSPVLGARLRGHQHLESALWDAANQLRVSAVDRTDWKGNILSLLFSKRLCDVWDEETSEATDLYGDTDSSLFSEVHRFQVPDGCHW
jgi:type I restriction enzyme M protein